MSRSISREELRAEIQATGGTWLEQAERFQDEMLAGFVRGLREFQKEYQRRFPNEEEPDPFALRSRNPAGAKAFFDYDTLVASVNIKIMIWRILCGYEFRRIHLDYQADGATTLCFTIGAPGCPDDPPYEADPYSDFGVLGHVGTFLRNDRFVIEGYYAFR